MIRNLFVLSACVVLACLSACGPDAQQDTAGPSGSGQSELKVVLDKALDALGGRKALEEMRFVTIQSSGERFEIDSSFMPGDVDTLPIPFTMTGHYDVAGDRMRLDYVRSRPAGVHTATTIVDGRLAATLGHETLLRPAGPAPMTSDQWAVVRKEQSLLNPHLAFRTALTSGTVSLGDDEILDDVVHHVLLIAAPVAPIRLYVDATTGRLSRLRTMETDHLRRDVGIEALFDNWEFTQGTVAFPGTVTMKLDGETLHTETREFVKTDDLLEPGLFTIPSEVTAVHDESLAEWGHSSHQSNQIMTVYGFSRSGRGRDTAVESEELAPGVHRVSGTGYHSLLVEQTDGLVVVEAPLHELRSEAVIEWIERTFPGKPVTHVITTHHHTDHAAGLRPYVARGVPVVAHQAAREFLMDVFRRPSKLRPDALELDPVEARIVTTDSEGYLSLPDTERSIEIYPLRNDDHAGDMLLTYVQSADIGIAFESDIFTYRAPPAPPPSAGVRELHDAIVAADIDVSVIVGGHGDKIDYAVFQSLLEE